jgi:hypothetical protein
VENLVPENGDPEWCPDSTGRLCRAGVRGCSGVHICCVYPSEASEWRERDTQLGTGNEGKELHRFGIEFDIIAEGKCDVNAEEFRSCRALQSSEGIFHEGIVHSTSTAQ